ncbi:MAG: MFS transporter [Ruminococcus sp.]|nr:MFS transporter [Ruminococcus sp.]
MTRKKTAGSRVLWIFAIGQLGWSMLSGIINNWLVFFYQPSTEEIEKGLPVYVPQGKILGLTAVGIIMAFGRIFDAVTDPLIAGKSDSLRHRLGRRIPFMRWAALPFAAATVMLFIAPFGEKSMGNAFFLFAAAALFYLCMTSYCTPYNALIPELGRTPEARINLSTYISVTFFIGTAAAYLIPNIASLFESSFGYAGSFKLTIGILSAVAAVFMLLPAFLIDENEYADTEPSKTPAFSSLAATFKNRDFRIFVCSDILYWIGLTILQTGLSYYITVLLGLPTGTTFTFFAVMSGASFLCYPAVNMISKKIGKKKVMIFAFLFFSFAFLVTAGAGMVSGIPPMAYGIVIAVLASVPMAILGILPSAVVSDISEADKAETGDSRQGMMFAARTFAFKLGQSAAMLLFTSISQINKDIPSGSSGHGLGYRLTAVTAAVFCLLGGIVFLKYDEKKVMSTTSQEAEK